MGSSNEGSRFRTGLYAQVEAGKLTPIEKPPLADYAASLRKVVAEFAPGSPVPVPRERLLELLEFVASAEGIPADDGRHLPDLRVDGVGDRMGRKPSTVRQMCADGEFDMPNAGDGAYKHRGKEWLVPEVAVRAYEERRRGGGRATRDNISDWKRVKATPTRRRNDAA